MEKIENLDNTTPIKRIEINICSACPTIPKAKFWENNQLKRRIIVRLNNLRWIRWSEQANSRVIIS